MSTREPSPQYPSPSAEEIRSLRTRHGLTQEQAAELVYVTRRGWQAWENDINPMTPGLWELFKIKAPQVAMPENPPNQKLMAAAAALAKQGHR